MPRKLAAVPEDPAPIDADRLTKKARQLKAPWPFLYSVTKKDGLVRNLPSKPKAPKPLRKVPSPDKWLQQSMDWDGIERGSI